MFDAGNKTSGSAGEMMGNWQAMQQLRAEQKHYHDSGATLSEAARREALLKLKKAIKRFEPELLEALAVDLKKSSVEAYMTEIGVVLTELSDALRHLRTWMKPRRRPTPLALWPARSEIRYEPLGRCLIMSPWNYPVLLNLAPLIAALAAGNVVVMKPSELAPATARALARLIKETFASRHVALVEGDKETSTWLLEQRWDMICYTGGTNVGRIVAEAAAKHLTPCLLELGGKSPCVVSDAANIEVAARRIVWGKFINAGQTCVAPDYVLATAGIYDRLIIALRKEILERFGAEALEHPQLPKIINSAHFQRLQRLLDPNKVVCGGKSDASRLLIEPTLLAGVNRSDPVMQEEIFGPILPILAVRNLQEAEDFIRTFEKPLALYLFSQDLREQERIVSRLSYGGGCINDVLLHTGNASLPFGGVGQSGMGSYHGVFGFKAFSHEKALVFNTTKIDPALRYGRRPFHEKLFRWFLR